MSRLAYIIAALTLASASASAQAGDAPTSAELSRASGEIQSACVARGEPAERCACGVRIARAELEPKVFVLIPKVEPILDEENPMRAIARLSAALEGAGLTLDDGWTAYQTIRDNRARVKKECGSAPG